MMPIEWRRVLGAGGLAGMVALAALGEEKADPGLALPSWREGDAGRIPLGGGLWPDDFRPGEVIHPAQSAPDGADAAGSHSEEDSWLRFLPRGLFGRQPPSRADEMPLEEMSVEALRASENAPASVRVLDPQGLLPEAQAEDLARLLAFHSENASVDARFLLIDTRQKLGGDADLSRLASGALARGTVCLVIYPLGAPHRARLFLSREISASVPAAYLAALAGACIREAILTPDPVEQLQRFATQLSIRLFWLERAYPAVKPDPVPADGAPPGAPAAEPLLEVRAVVAPPPNRGPSLDAFRLKWKPVVLPALAAAVALVAIAFFGLRWWRRRLRQTVWLLPEYDHRHPARFGGPHCGACGAAVKYG